MSIKRFFNGEKNAGRISAKLVTIGLLIIFFIPVTALVQGMIEEREDRQYETIEEVSSKWGAEQVVTGPIMVVPYQNVNSYLTQYAYFLPEELNISGDIRTELRSRGIYDVPLYDSALKLSGKFNNPDFTSLGASYREIYWDQAAILLEISDMRGMTDQVTMNFDGQSKQMSSGVKGDLITNGISSSVGLNLDKSSYDFNFDLNLRGSQSLYFTPIGKTTKVSMSSDWLSPSFNGGFLPTEHSITTEGFDASWDVLDLNTTFAQSGTSDTKYSLSRGLDSENSFGVDFFMPVDVYQKSVRSAKYAIAVISLVFLVFFLVEVIAKRRIHPLQYLLVGLALVIFYTLLLSFAEYISFGYAYTIASTSIIAMITLFSKSVMRKMKLALTSGAVVLALYIFIYVLLQMEDYTLLVGSIGIFIILALVMYATRYIDFYGEGSSA